MGIVDWFKKRQAEGQRLRADARHMRQLYQASAVEMCEFAIAAARDGRLRHQLRQIRRMLLQETRGGRRLL